jgi:hypothetical protein
LGKCSGYAAAVVVMFQCCAPVVLLCVLQIIAVLQNVGWLDAEMSPYQEQDLTTDKIE